MKQGTLAGAGLVSVVGFLAFVELTSGILQGWYVPMFTDIARHLGINDADVNWLEAASLTVSALVVPAMAKLGDMVGHKRILLVSTALTAAASLVLPFTDSFIVFLIAWALQGFYVVWLPLEIALIWSRTEGRHDRSRVTAKAAGVLVAALEVGAITGALLGGALVDVLDLWVVLLIPGIAVVACFFVILFGVSESPNPTGGRLDTPGLILISLALVVFMGGLSFLRINGVGDPFAWALVLGGLALGYLFVRFELRVDDPVIDVRLFLSPSLWPVFLTAGLFGVSVLGAQVPLSTFARTDPETYGYGLGLAGFGASLIIGIYLVGMIVGALLFPFASRLATPRLTLAFAAVLVGIGYLLFLPFHEDFGQVIVNMSVVGIGSGALVAALPAAAAAAAPDARTGVATGLTNSVKTVGGAIASCIFGIALFHGVTASGAAADGTAGSYSGYLTVWTVCGVTALVSATLLLLVVPRQAFTDKAVANAAEQPALPQGPALPE